jgi:hypothetical protein
MTKRLLFLSVVGCLSTTFATPQTSLAASQSPEQRLAALETDQVSDLLGLTQIIHRLQSLHAQKSCASTDASLEELTLRQYLLESVERANLDVDSAMGVIANERGKLSNLQTSLTANRDKTIARLNAAALITGSGIGAAVSATQFTTVGNRTNNVGDGIGIGAGAASTLLAYLAIRKQRGADSPVRGVTNMLAPLFDRSPSLNTYYPPVVLQYLQLVPPNQATGPGTRLEQLKAEWTSSGRLDSSDATKERKINALTATGETGVKVSIGDLTDRIAMLGDVSGRIALMKRDLSLLMLSYMTDLGCSVK